MKKLLVVVLVLFFSGRTVAAEGLTIAAAADLQFAMKGLLAIYKKEHPQTDIKAIYGSSGNFFSQIKQGAPYDLFFSADLQYPETLDREGLTEGPPKSYAVGRLVLWSRKGSGVDLGKGLMVLLDPRVRKIAMANPDHAPYGKRAKESLIHYRLWEKVREKLVFGENIAQAAQFAQTGNADAGILSLSFTLVPAMSDGDYVLIDPQSHQSLEQAYVILKRGTGKQSVDRFVEFMKSEQAETILRDRGFTLP